jgi:hypothetical protein
MTSLPPELSWESFTLPVWIITKLRADWPCAKSSSLRAKLRALAHEAISRHSSFDRPLKSAEAAIMTTRSAMLDSLVDSPSNTEPATDKRPVAIVPPKAFVRVAFKAPCDQARFHPKWFSGR